MNRVTVNSGEIPRTVDFLQAQQNAMIALAKLSLDVMGGSGVVCGFAATPTTPASLSVTLNAGTLYQQAPLEATAWSSLPADTSDTLVKQGIALEAQPFTFTPPTATGFSQVFLIEVQYDDNDTDDVVLPYFDAPNPSAPFSGPGNSGEAQATIRQGLAAVQIKAGTAAATGTQVSPTQDSGWIGLWYVTVEQGQTTITSGNITEYPNAPFVGLKLPAVPAFIQAGTATYFVDSSVTANTIDVAPSPAPASITPGTSLSVKVANAVTGAATIVVTLANGTTQTNNLVTGAAQAPTTGQISAGTIIDIRFDGTNWQFIGAASGLQPTRTSSAATVNLSCATDYYVGLTGTAQTVNVAASGTLNVGQTFVIDDILGTADTNNKTVTPPAGHNFAGLAVQFVMNRPRQSVRVTYYGSSTWGIADSA
jgi:hypothetical protein